MDKINDGGPAFPVGSGDMRDPVGMTLRDYFAAKAVQGYCSREGSIDCNADDTAADAYAIADAMLKEREYRP